MDTAGPVTVTTGAISFSGGRWTPVAIGTGPISFVGVGPNASGRNVAAPPTTKTISTNPISFTGNKTR